MSIRYIIYFLAYEVTKGIIGSVIVLAIGGSSYVKLSSQSYKCRYAKCPHHD